MWPKNITFGEGTLYMKDIEVPTIPEVELDWPPEESSEPAFRIPSEPMEFELESPEINSELVDKLVGVDLAHDCDMGYTLEYFNARQVQVRRHKKKRINKKWAKRYGFRTVYDKVRFKEVSLVHKDDGTYECVTNQPYEFVKGK